MIRIHRTAGLDQLGPVRCPVCPVFAKRKHPASIRLRQAASVAKRRVPITLAKRA